MSERSQTTLQSEQFADFRGHNEKSSRRAGWTAHTLAWLSMLTPAGMSATSFFSASPVVSGANNQIREKALTEFAADSWQVITALRNKGDDPATLPGIDSHWNNLIAAMHVSDNTAVSGVDPIRFAIIERGAVDPMIAPRVVHSALYTLGVRADALRTELAGLREEYKKDSRNEGISKRIRELETKARRIIDSAVPYVGKVIVDTTSAGGRLERRLLSPSLAEEARSKYPITRIYNDAEFHRLASSVIGRISDPGVLDAAASRLFSPQTDAEQADALFEIFLHTAPEAGLPEAVRKRAYLAIFDRTCLNNYLAAKAAASMFPGEGFITPAGEVSGEIPGVPINIKSGSLEVLKTLNTGLVTPKLSFPFALDAKSQERTARSILLLARSKDPLALPAAAQWFASKPREEGAALHAVSSQGDLIALQALAMCARRDTLGFEVFKRVGASFPDLVLADALLSGSRSRETGPLGEAGTESVRLINEHRDEARSWLQSIARQDAAMIWPSPRQREEMRTYDATRAVARRFALQFMALTVPSASFSDTFMAILVNPFASSEDVQSAIFGLAMEKNREAIPLLLKKGSDSRQPAPLRTLALDAALYIDSPRRLPLEVEQRILKDAPLSPALADLYYPVYAGEGFGGAASYLKSPGLKNPFELRMETEIAHWLKAENAMRRLGETGKETAEVTPAEKIAMQISYRRRLLGGGENILSATASDKILAAETLLPMVQYLEAGRQKQTPLDPSIAIPMMAALSRAQYLPANRVLVDIATHPELYGRNTPSLEPDPFAVVALKAAAIESCGGTAELTNPDDAGAVLLHRVAKKDSSRIFRESALSGLYRLAIRYSDHVTEAAEPARTALAAAKNAHGRLMFDTFEYHRQGLEPLSQVRLFSFQEQFHLARIADLFGAAKELLLSADSAIGQDIASLRSGKAGAVDERPPVVRSIVQALIANGRKVDEIPALGLDEKTSTRCQEMFRFIANQEYWLGGEQTPAGQGTEVAVVDVGYVLPLDITKSMNSRVIYPERLMNWSDLLASEEVHPTMVAWTIHQAARDTRLRSYSVSAPIPKIQFMPSTVQEPIMRAFEDMVELQLVGTSNIGTINYSLGWLNIVLNDSRERREFVDLMASYMELLSRMDVKHSVAAGNYHGADPARTRFGAIGEVNNLGLRFEDISTARKPDHVFIASAVDAYTGRLAEFTSKQEELRLPETIRLRALHGVQVLVPNFDWGEWSFSPVDGTSFAAPNQTALFARAEQALGSRKLSYHEWQGLLDRSIRPLKGREPYEGGDVFDVGLFTKELEKLLDDSKK